MSLNKLALVLKEIQDAHDAVTDLRKFVKIAWPIIEPGTPYVHGWHIDAMCDHLTAMSNGEIKDLLINVPPRHAKSSVVSVLWPAWEWLTKPSLKWLYSSYAQSLSTRDALKTRRLIQSPWYQKHFGDRYQLAKDQKTKTRYDNDHGGYRIATSVDGSNTGEGGDRIVCFDWQTKIALQYGELPIGRLHDNKTFIDVWSYNKHLKRMELKPILQFFCNKADETVKITLVNDKFFQCTPEHLIWTGNRQWVKAKDLNDMDALMNVDGKHDYVRGVEHVRGTINVYNIEVADNNNYFAGGYLVHNCDDGNNAAEGESEAVLESTSIWWKEVMSTRKNDPFRSTRCMVGQRVGARDLSQVFLESANPVHLCLPAEYEGDKKITSIGWQDPRTEMGELLWPHRFTHEILEKLKKELGRYGTAGQLQQRPTPREGGIIMNAWLQYYKLTKDINGRIIRPTFRYIVQSWDTAFKDGEQNDFSVCLTFGIEPTGIYLIHRWKGKVDFPELEKLAIELANVFPPNDLLIEDKASGQSLIQSLKKRTRLPVRAIKVDRDKIARCYAVSPFIESGKFFIPEGEPWVIDYVDNLVTFPGAQHDDEVDATTQALNEYGVRRFQQNQQTNNVSIFGR